MSQPEPVEPKTRKKLVMGEVWLGFPQWVRLFIVATDRKDRVRVFVNCGDIRQLNARGVAFRVFVLEALNVELGVDFVHFSDIVSVGLRQTFDAVYGLVDRVAVVICREGQVNVSVEPRHLLFAQVIVSDFEDMSYTWAREQVRRRVWNNDVLRRNETRHLTSHSPVEISLFKRGPRQREIEKHLVHFRIVLFHHLGDLVVHEVLDALGLLFNLLVHRAHDPSLNRASGRQELFVSLRLELSDALRDHWVRDGRGALERRRPLFLFDAQKTQPLNVGLFPLRAGCDVVLD